MFDGPTGDDRVMATDDRGTATENAFNKQLNRADAARVRPECLSLNSRPKSLWLEPQKEHRGDRTGGLGKATGPGRTVILLCMTSLLTVSLFAMSPIVQSAAAGFPESYERWERTYGVGWGDGYQAQFPSGPRPFADLPPKFPRRSGTHDQRTSCPGCGTRNSGGNTYYDRFDAYAESLEVSPDPGPTPGRALSPEQGGALSPEQGGALSPEKSGALSPELNRIRGLSPQQNAGSSERRRSSSASGHSVLVGRTDGDANSARSNADRTDRETAMSRPANASPRGKVRPGLSHARLPSVVPPAMVRHPSSHGRESDQPSGDAPRVAQVPESLIIRQPR